MEQEVTNFARFYMTFNKMKYTGDREEMKRNIVRQYTWDRTDSLRAVTFKEYNAICDGIEKLYGNKDAYREAIRKHRSVVLKLMQKIGIDTTDWTRINAFCKDERLAGKEFARLDGEELEALAVKLRVIQKKGGLRKKEEKQVPQAQAVYVVMNGSASNNN